LPGVLHLREIEEGAKAIAVDLAELGKVVVEVKAKVDKATCGRFTINEDVSLREMPASRADKELANLVAELVHPVPRLVMEVDCPINCVS